MSYRLYLAIHELMSDARQPALDLSSFFHLPADGTDSRGWLAVATPIMIQWCRWNYNKLIYGFESILSRYPQCFPSWEHSRIMSLFLRSLPAFAGALPPGTYPQLWQRSLTEEFKSPNDVIIINTYPQRGLAMGNNMVKYGYAFMDDVFDWTNLTIPSHLSRSFHYLLQNRRQENRYRKYSMRVQSTSNDLISVDFATRWLREFKATPACVTLISEFLHQLCLWSFRQAVFTQLPKKVSLVKKYREDARSGAIDLTWTTMQHIICPRPDWTAVKLMHGRKLKYGSYSELFAYLWTNRGDQKRGPWRNSPYRVLYQQSLEAFRSTIGFHGEHKFDLSIRQRLRATHWLLPYPSETRLISSSKDGLHWWSNYHFDLDDETRRQPFYKIPKGRLAIPWSQALCTSERACQAREEGWNLNPTTGTCHFVMLLMRTVTVLVPSTIVDALDPINTVLSSFSTPGPLSGRRISCHDPSPILFTVDVVHNCRSRTFTITSMHDIGD